MNNMPRILTEAKEQSDSTGLIAGIDTHKQTHHVAVINRFGQPVTDQEFPATARGYERIVELFNSLGDVAGVGVEGTGSYGAEITRVLVKAGFDVVEVMRTNRQARRRRGKSDPLDAHQAALAVLSRAETGTPKAGDGPVEAMRILLSERRSTIKARTQALNQIHSLLITAPEEVRGKYRHLPSKKLVRVLAATRPGKALVSSPGEVAKQSLKRLAHRCVQLGEQIDLIDDQLHSLVRQTNPRLLTIFGIGPFCIASELIRQIGFFITSQVGVVFTTFGNGDEDEYQWYGKSS